MYRNLEEIAEKLGARSRLQPGSVVAVLQSRCAQS